ncbi:MAG TPA: TIGR00282 family metallophosphoesterase [Candidatus Babeliales bacterium]|nr:TIGR00282 family metallophosphoesterase [Candidatus Babeliales bacterium]
MAKLRILFIGDVVGAAGRVIFQKHIEKIKKTHNINAVVVNGENCAHGRGITSKNMRFFKHNGVDVVTSGNHIWRHKEIYTYLDENDDLLRPANFPAGVPGVGVATFMVEGHRIGIINLQGRVFMKELIDCPFYKADAIVEKLREKTNIIFLDFHAEATSEKMAMSFFLEGRVSGVVGTHTHVQTADERVLPGGTAHITDLGMSGSLNSMLGMKKESIIHNFLTALPVKFNPDTALPIVMSGAWIEVDTDTGKALHIERIRIIDNELQVGSEDE